VPNGNRSARITAIAFAMGDIIQLTGPHRALTVFGVRLVGLNVDNGKKFLFSVVFILVIWLAGRGLKRFTRAGIRRNERRAFWIRQAISIAIALINVVGLLSIWFDDPARLATAVGFFTAGLAFALQRVVTAFAGYMLILRGRTFNVGDRITMGGIRGDVIGLGFLQTVIMEMGQPPEVQSADPAMWVQSRQYSGRIVTVSNAKVFEEPVYNYTRDFPFIWEEMHIPISYDSDRRRAEQIILDAVRAHVRNIADLGEDAIDELERRYFVKRSDLGPRVYLRLTDNWIELSARFIVEVHGIRDIKNEISRKILDEFDRARIGIASGTYQVVGMPPLKVELANPPAVGVPGNGAGQTSARE
jgi:small-conductance mechanosensitive channel